MQLLLNLFKQFDYENFKLTFLFAIAVLLISCEQNDVTPKETNNEPLYSFAYQGPDTLNPDNPVQLCIFCGCERNYSTCKNAICFNYGPHACCSLMDVNAIDLNCCVQSRIDCHTCLNGAWICTRMSLFDSSTYSIQQQSEIANGREIFNYNELTNEQKTLLEPYTSVVEKWQNGITLDDSDYETLDKALDEF